VNVNNSNSIVGDVSVGNANIGIKNNVVVHKKLGNVSTETTNLSVNAKNSSVVMNKHVNNVSNKISNANNKNVNVVRKSNAVAKKINVDKKVTMVTAIRANLVQHRHRHRAQLLLQHHSQDQ